MKIHDIISETPVQEAGMGIIKTAAALAKPHLAKLGAKAVSKMGGQTGDTVRGAVAGAKNFGSSIAKPLNVFAKLTGNIGMFVKYFGLYQMFSDYNAEVKRATADYQAGKLTPEQYQENLKQQKAILVAQLAIALPGFLALKISSNWSFWVIGLKASPNVLAKAIGASMAGLAVSSQAALIQLLRTDKFANMYAEFIAGSVIGDVSQALFDKVSGLIGLAEKKADATPDAASSTDKAATSTTPSTSTNKPGATAEPEQDRPGVYKPNPKFDAFFKN